jgi:pseudouridine-5'-monophosphatase
VLVDTEPLYTEAIRTVVARFGKQYDWSLKARCMGNPAGVSARLIVEELELPLTAEAFLALRAPILEALFEAVPEIAGAAALVAGLSRRGFSLGLATSSDQQLLAKKTRHHAFMSHFATVVCADDVGLAKPKPAPDIFLLAAERMGVPAGKCVVFEDSPTGVRAGVAAGMRVVALCDPALDPALLAGAERIIQSYAEFDVAEFVAGG